RARATSTRPETLILEKRRPLLLTLAFPFASYSHHSPLAHVPRPPPREERPLRRRRPLRLRQARHVQRPLRRGAALSTEDERRVMQMAAKHTTTGAGDAGAGGATGAEMGATAGKGAPRPRLSERARGGAAVPTPIPAPVEKEKPTPRGVLPALLERRAPWLLDPTRKTPFWAHGEHSAPLWSSSSSPVSLGLSCPPTPFLPLIRVPRRRPHALVSDCPAGRVMGTKPRTSGCSAADLAFTAFLTVLAAYTASRARSSRGTPELFSPDETCGLAAVAHLTGMLVLPVIRLPFLLAVSAHYAHLVATITANGGPGQALRLLPLPPM
ncbi:hypothetical protein FB451DRAFT_1452207, partial [Mycena latifolia]